MRWHTCKTLARSDGLGDRYGQHVTSSFDMLRYLLYPFLAYRSVLYPTLLVSAVVVPCWLAVQLYRRRTPAQRGQAPRGQ